MKNKIAGCIATLLVMLAFTPANAQCTVVNTTNCNVQFDATEYLSNCTTICSGPTGYSLGNGSVSICTGNCPARCKSIFVTTVASVTVSVFVSTVTGPFTATGNLGSAGCGASTMSVYYDNTVTPGVFRIVP